MEPSSNTTALLTTTPPSSSAPLAGLSDAELLTATWRLIGRSNQLLASLLAHLAEVEARGIHRARACASLYTYCVYELRFSEDEAFRRVSAARLVRRFPALLDAIAAGELHLTGLLMLGPHLTPDNLVEVLALSKHRTKKELARLVRRLDPLPEVPSRIGRASPSPAPTWSQSVRALNPIRELEPGARPRDWMDWTHSAPSANDGPALARSDDGSALARSDDGSALARSDDGSALARSDDGSALARSDDGSALATLARCDDGSALARSDDGSALARSDDGSALARSDDGSALAPLARLDDGSALARCDDGPRWRGGTTAPRWRGGTHTRRRTKPRWRRWRGRTRARRRPNSRGADWNLSDTRCSSRRARSTSSSSRGPRPSSLTEARAPTSATCTCARCAPSWPSSSAKSTR